MNKKIVSEQPVMPGDKSTGQAVDKRRRSLLTAGAAAPAVLTLTPVSAAAGSITECVANQKEQPKNMFSKWTDKWARQEVKAFWVQRDSGLKGDQRAAQLKPDGVKAEAYERTVPMKGGDMVGGTDPDDAFLLIDFEKYASDLDGNRWSKGFRDSYVSPLGDSYSRTWVEEKRFAIIYVTDDGRILGIGPEHADSGKAVMLSCWSSVAEAAAKQVW
jgi:hypothetical protein